MAKNGRNSCCSRNNGCLVLRQPLSALKGIISCSRASHLLNPRQPLAQAETAIGSNKDCHCRRFPVVRSTKARSKRIEYSEQTIRKLGLNVSKARNKVPNSYVLGVKQVRMLIFLVACLSAKYGEKHRKKRFMYAF